MVNIGNSWDELLHDEFESEYYQKIRGFLKQEYDQYTIYPPKEDIFNALKYTPYENVKIVLLGQDPYHGAGQAHGLCFSVKPGVTPPPSLRNIFKELQQDVCIDMPPTGELTAWAKRGVLLLNTVLTVREGQANSHKNLGWQQLTDAIIRKLNERDAPVVFLLWGANAREKRALLNNPKHLVLESVHPSPLSAYQGFFGCAHFSKANEFLHQHGVDPVNWDLCDVQDVTEKQEGE